MAGHAGFDRSDYPGDAVMAWLKANSNLVWCGYYFGVAPSHSGTSWMGKRAQLVAAGWGIAPLYVGEQVIGPGSENPSAAKGTTDGDEAVKFMQDEGFARTPASISTLKTARCRSGFLTTRKHGLRQWPRAAFSRASIARTP